MQAVDKQPWDPGVKALTQFPSVLDNMAKNLSWTSALGEAYHTQPADVMSAVQVLRAKAQAAGNLKSGSQITVVQQSPQTIVIQPTNPQVVYVPQYNPTVVYGAPVETPGYSTADMAAIGLLAFGVGIAVGAAINNSCCGWGYSYWNCNWHGGTVVYHSNVYYGNTAWHGGYYGSSATRLGLRTIRPPELMHEAHPSQPPTAREVPVKPTTQTPALMREVHQLQVLSEARQRLRRTTQEPEPMAPRVKPPTPMATTEVRLSQRTARPPTRSIKQPPRLHRIGATSTCQRRAATGCWRIGRI